MKYMGVVTDASWIEPQFITGWHYLNGNGFKIPDSTMSDRRIYSDEINLATDKDMCMRKVQRYDNIYIHHEKQKRSLKCLFCSPTCLRSCSPNPTQSCSPFPTSYEPKED